jgi:toxin ParE1/3/4
MIDAVTVRPRARTELIEQFVYLGERAGVETAELFSEAVGTTCTRLVAQPLSGERYDSGIERLAGLRRVRVKGFDNYLLFYLPRPGGIDVVRVLHGARDIESIFTLEES